MTSADRRLIKRAEEMDQRRQRQVQNQIDSINRLLVNHQVPDPERATQEITALNERLAEAHAALASISTALRESLTPDGVYFKDDNGALGAIHEAMDSWYALRPEEHRKVLGHE